jgi:PPOX class probable F420-dependent enzyme
MAIKMTTEQWHTFVGAGTRTGKLATVRADGSPHVAPVWYILDGDDLVFMTGAETVKGKAMRRDPRVALSVDDETPPFAFAVIEGTVTLDEDLDTMLPLSIKIAERYMGAEQAEAFGRRNAVPGEMLVRLTPTKVIAITDLTD